ncbi:hypothetical protein PAXINDRAFT_16388 [Paxillus involutus ATCC 200175]|uniref:Uncharacterized protein n=1 Tax=Paxillus involutus ATCC 200175 TaxID=664439 RepID=A0A0C9TIR2_PAXIN|nr:hypothetical protein PAXINDRAFT_16388 [Paxillus involutus ATCC 200175]
MAKIPTLRKDRWNWSIWCESFERALNKLGVHTYLSGMKPNPYNEQANTIAKCAIASSIPDLLFLRILNFESAYKYFKTLKNLFEMDTFTMELLQEIWNNRMKQEVVYSLETTSDICDTSHHDGGASNGSGRRTNNVPSNKPHRQHQWKPKRQGRVEERSQVVGEKGRVLKGENDEWVAAASKPGNGAMDQWAGGADDEDGDDVDVDHTHVVLQTPHLTHQTADDDEATDTTDPHANSTGPTVPVGTTNEPLNGIDNEVEGGNGREVNKDIGIEDEEGEWASGINDLSSNNDGGDEDVRHVYVIPNSTQPVPYHAEPPPDESRPPLSVSLEGEMSGKQSSNHADKAATHLERPPDESTTTPPVWTLLDKKSSGEGQGTAMSHREAVGGDDKVEGSNHSRDMLNRVDEWRCQKEKARDEATGDEDHRENREEYALHDPGGQTDAPDSVPPSIRLKGERNRLTSLYVESVDDHAEDDDHTQQPSRHPVGTMDGDERCPSEPTEAPDEKEGERGVDRSRGDERDELKEIEGKLGDQSEGDGCQQDGRTINTGDATSSTTPDLKRVKAGPLADDETSQQWNTTHSPRKPATSQRMPQDATYERQQARAHGVRTKSDGHADHIPGQSDVTETVQGYRGSVPEPPQSRTKGTKAHTSTPHTIDITYL